VSRLFLGIIVVVPMALSACADMVKSPSGSQASLSFAAFSGIVDSVQGGKISRVVYAEVPGDASLSSVSASGGELTVKGLLTSKAGSKWAGVGVSIGAPTFALDASRFRALRIQLSAAPGVDQLRIRLKANSRRTGPAACNPTAVQMVTAQVTEYEIAFSQFAPERSCTDQAVPVAVVVNRLGAIEIVDAANPVRDRESEFTIGNIVLVR
jgi:hypothetical protein